MFRKLFVLLNTFALGIAAGAVVTKKFDKLPRLDIVDYTEYVTASVGKRSPAANRKKIVRTTAYCHLENEPGAYKDLNCLGTKLKYETEPRSAAADWSIYPVGTQFRIAGDPHLYEIDDYGSGLVGKDTIDLYKPTLELMDEWGVRNVEIEIVKWGSFRRSIEVMTPRLDYPHIAEMYQNILAKL